MITNGLNYVTTSCVRFDGPRGSIPLSFIDLCFFDKYLEKKLISIQNYALEIN